MEFGTENPWEKEQIQMQEKSQAPSEREGRDIAPQAREVDKKFVVDNDIKQSIANIDRILSLNEKRGDNITSKLLELSDLVKSLKEALTKLEMFHSVGASGNSGDINNIGQKVQEEVEKLSKKIDDIKDEITALSKEESRVETSSAKFEIEKEHKMYFTLTAVFAIALVLSAILTTRGFIAFLPNYGLCIAAWVFVGASFLAISVFNFVFAIINVDIHMNDAARLVYFIVCGVLIAVTIGLSVAVLAI